MRIMLPLVLFSAVIAVILGFWTWMGAPIALPTNLASVPQSFCLSYSPFRGTEIPTPGIDIPESRIDEDLQKLSSLTRCVRTYLADRGLQHVPAIAARYGMKVQQGIWIGRNQADNNKQITAAVSLARRHPSIKSLTVGNETLYGGEQDVQALLELIRRVKRQVSVPVTYADLPSTWERHPELAKGVDFITVHVLPYWDRYEPEKVAAYMGDVLQRLKMTYHGKHIVIGEVGWPSQGRTRGVAEASPASQARVVRDVIALADRMGLEITLLEAFDQPWKRGNEGTVGGYWGIFDAQTRELKFSWDGPVSNHPQWRKQAGGGVLMSVLIFVVAFLSRDKRLAFRSLSVRWACVSIIAAVAGVTVGLAFERIPIESFDAGARNFSLIIAALALASPVCAAPAVMRGRRVPGFAELFGGASSRPRDPIEIACGVGLLLLGLSAIIAVPTFMFRFGLGDFPAAAVTGAVVPFVVLAFRSDIAERIQAVETAMAVLLVVPVPFLLRYEWPLNWQMLWTSLLLLVLGATLLRTHLRQLVELAGRSAAQAVRRRAAT